MLSVTFFEEARYQLLFFFPGSTKYTLFTPPNKFTYHSTNQNLLNNGEVQLLNEINYIRLSVNDKNKGVFYMEEVIKESPLCVNLYRFDDGKRRLYGTATIFKRGKRYDLINFAVAEVSKEKFNYVSLGVVSFEGALDFVKKDASIPDFYEEQLKYYELIENAENEIKQNFPSSQFASKKCYEIKYTTLNQSTRVFANVFVPVPLRYIPIPSNPVFPNLAPEEAIKKGIKWIQDNKGFTYDYHMVNEKKIKTDAWKSMFIQATGNCKDQALTMYQMLSSQRYKNWEFALCCILLKDGDTLLNHCVCVAFHDGIREIIDATIEGKNDYEENYDHVVTLFTKQDTYFLLNENKIGVMVKDFIEGNYVLKEKFSNSHIDVSTAYKYNLSL